MFSNILPSRCQQHPTHTLPQVENLLARERQINDLRTPSLSNLLSHLSGWKCLLFPLKAEGKYFSHAFIPYSQTSQPNLPEKSALLVRSTEIRRVIMLELERLTHCNDTLAWSSEGHSATDRWETKGDRTVASARKGNCSISVSS